MPSLHTDLVGARIAGDRQFAESLLIGQLSPGPTGLWSVSLGYLTRGIFGAFAALLAASLPPLLVLVVERIYRRIERHPAVEGFVRGLSLAIVGVFVVILARLLNGIGADWRAGIVAVCAIGIGTIRRVPIVAILAAAGVAGILVYR